MNRRNFVVNTSAALAFSSVFPDRSLNLEATGKLESIGIQLFSVPKLLEADFEEGLKMLAQMGYKELELYGPYPFSVEKAKKRWAGLTPMLGFSGSGFFGKEPEEVRALCEDLGLRITAIHTDLQTLETRMTELGAASRILGFEYAGLPAIPEEMRNSLDDYKKIADIFNKIGKSATEEGFKFAYHNHGYGLQEMEGVIPMQLILEETDSSSVFFEMDIFWTTAGKADPKTYLESNPDRYRLMHIKDMREIVHFSGDGGSPMEWMQLFPHMTSAGEGALDIKGIIESAQKSGVQHFYVEQDMVSNPQQALKQSIDYLNSI